MIEAWPRLSSTLNRSKRKAALELESLASEIESAITLLGAASPIVNANEF